MMYVWQITFVHFTDAFTRSFRVIAEKYEDAVFLARGELLDEGFVMVDNFAVTEIRRIKEA
jgi:hypothetical protein